MTVQMSRTAAVLSALEGRWYVPVVRDEDMGVSRVLHPWNPDKETLRYGVSRWDYSSPSAGRPS